MFMGLGSNSLILITVLIILKKYKRFNLIKNYIFYNSLIRYIIFIELRYPNSAPATFGFKGTGSGSHYAIESLRLRSGGRGVRLKGTDLGPSIMQSNRVILLAANL